MFMTTPPPGCPCNEEGGRSSVRESAGKATGRVSTGTLLAAAVAVAFGIVSALAVLRPYRERDDPVGDLRNAAGL